MKKFLPVFFAIAALVLLASAIAFPVFAQAATPPGAIATVASTPVNFTLSQLAAIGVIASFLVILIRLLLEIAMKRKFVVPDWVMIVIVYVFSFAVAVWWFPQAMPTFPIFSPTDPVSWVPAFLGYVSNVLVALTAYAAAAGAIYAVLFQKVKDGIGQVVAPAAYPPLPPKA